MTATISHWTDTELRMSQSYFREFHLKALSFLISSAGLGTKKRALPVVAGSYFATMRGASLMTKLTQRRYQEHCQDKARLYNTKPGAWLPSRFLFYETRCFLFLSPLEEIPDSWSMLFPNCYDFSIANTLSAYYLTFIVLSKINHNIDAIISCTVQTVLGLRWTRCTLFHGCVAISHLFI